jgi:hypothetical protein
MRGRYRIVQNLVVRLEFGDLRDKRYILLVGPELIVLGLRRSHLGVFNFIFPGLPMAFAPNEGACSNTYH